MVGVVTVLLTKLAAKVLSTSGMVSASDISVSTSGQCGC